ncbi:hypothetical protein GLAREA_06835 [Glarea lozoyensis ATCC 20868]|uniref:Uncharacterized protein n=1 Tax=Glarea lozoyensis (strain ATCC 20868 / MF5171) TaxID=1116229 RepID=S3D5V7_GLAL2|nr:uncharacterized protein GLAREA_06835 [Glarea lozoyensis ATCC 20868]EPE33822.1 hypothetical protein GLAREA_06835 [Glarea lozoyensis ATCC 20868]
MPPLPSENPDYTTVQQTALRRYERAVEAVALAKKKLETAENDLEATELRLEGARAGVKDAGVIG